MLYVKIEFKIYQKSNFNLCTNILKNILQHWHRLLIVTPWPTNMDEIREKYNGGENATKEAFEELCAMVENMNVSIMV